MKAAPGSIATALWMSVVSACAPTRGAEEAEVVTLDSVSARQVPPEVVPAVDATPVLLGDLACTWTTSDVSSAGDSPIRLCDASKTHCFLEAPGKDLSAGLISLSMEAGRPPAFFAQLSYGGMSVRGFLQRPPSLNADHPFVFARAWIPKRLRAVEALHGRLRAALDDPASKETVEDDVLCDAVSPQRQWWSPSEELPLVGNSTAATPMQIPRGDVRFFDAQGELVARLSLEDPVYVDAFQSQKTGRRLVSVPREGASLVGWVDAKLLMPVPPRIGLGWVSSGPSFAGEEDPSPGMHCSWPLRLFARFDSMEPPLVYEIGVIEDGAPFTVIGPTGRGLTAVGLRHRIATTEEVPPRTKLVEGLRIASGVKLVVMSADLKACGR